MLFEIRQIVCSKVFYFEYRNLNLTFLWKLGAEYFYCKVLFRFVLESYMLLSQRAENKFEDSFDSSENRADDFVANNQMVFKIKLFSAEYYPQIVRLWNEAFPSQQRTEDEWRFKDEQLAERLNKHRFVALANDRVVGYANIQLDELMTDPEVYVSRVAVDSAYQRQGLGTVLAERLIRELEKLKARALRVWVREDNWLGMNFAAKLEFSEFHRIWASELSPKSVDFSALNLKKEVSQEITIKTLEELQNDPERDFKLYELERELLLDMQAPDRVNPPPYEIFVDALHNDPQVLPDGYFVAVDNDDRYVGLSVFLANRASNELTTKLTGVRAAYRRQGIALRLKTLGIKYALEHGYAKIRTANDSLNEGMLAINNLLGFKREPAWILYSKDL